MHHTAIMAVREQLNGSELMYFPLQGRGESIRLALTIAGVDFVDKRLPGKLWGAEKSKTVRCGVVDVLGTLFRAAACCSPASPPPPPRCAPPSPQPWGSMPVLTLADGTTQIAQSKALLRLAGKASSLYPVDDAIRAAQVDEIVDFCDDIAASVNPIGRGMESEDKNAARLACVSPGGKIYAMLEKLDASIGARGAEGFAVGSGLTTADVQVFANTTSLISGFWDGVPPTTLDGFANIQAVRKNVATQPAVLAWYDSGDRGTGYGAAFKAARDL